MVFLFVGLVIFRGPKLRLEYNQTRVVVLRLRSPDTEFIYKGFIKEMFPEKKQTNKQKKRGKAGKGRRETSVSTETQAEAHRGGLGLVSLGLQSLV